jgi:hypothetical protein
MVLQNKSDNSNEHALLYCLLRMVLQNKSDNCPVHALQKQLKNNQILTFCDLFSQFFGSHFVSICYFRFVRFRFASADFQLFASKLNKRKKQIFFRFEAKQICLFFTSFCFNRKRTAHPTMNYGVK